MFTIKIVYFNYDIRKYQEEYVSHKDILICKSRFESKLKEFKSKGYTYSYDYLCCNPRALRPH
ncbi:MAG: hypothetical protein ACRCXT_04355 [Paraclostridium sp.]